MSKPLKGILKNTVFSHDPLSPKKPLPDEWKGREEIIPHVWLGSVTQNVYAHKTDITEVICISREPQADLQREGYRKVPHLESSTFTIKSDTVANLLEIFGEICDVIDGILVEGGGVLLLSVGGGVAAVAAYVMRKQKVSLPEAMLAITEARLKQQNARLLPSKRIIEMLNNDIWLRQLEMWQACKYNIYDYTIVNPKDPPERWIVEKVSYDYKIVNPKDPPERWTVAKVSESPQGKSGDVPSVLKSPDKRVRQISEQPHRLSTIEEEEEEARRLSMIEGTSSSPKDAEVDEEARRLGSTSRARVRGIEFDMHL